MLSWKGWITLDDVCRNLVPPVFVTLPSPDLACAEGTRVPVTRQRRKLVWHRSIRKLIEREGEDDLARLERLRQEAANDQMQFADPHWEARQADDQILDHFRLPQPRGSCGLPQGYFAAAQRERKTLGLPLAGPLDAILDLFFSLGAELNIAIIDGTSRRFIGGW